MHFKTIIQLHENREVKLLKLSIELKIKANTITLTFGTKAFVYSSHNEFAECSFLEFWDHSICFFQCGDNSPPGPVIQIFSCLQGKLRILESPTLKQSLFPPILLRERAHVWRLGSKNHGNVKVNTVTLSMPFSDHSKN